MKKILYLLTLICFTAQAQIVINEKDRIPMEAVKIRGVDTVYTNDEGEVMVKLSGQEAYAISSSTASGVMNPEKYGAIGKNKTCAQMGWSATKIETKWPDATAMFGTDINRTVDYYAWQQALIKQGANGKIIVPSLPQYWFNYTLYYDGLEPYIVGNKNKIWVTHSGYWLGRKDHPTTRSQMEAMFSATNMTVTGLHIIGNGQSGGIEANSVRFARITNNELNNIGKWAIAADFAMYGWIHQNLVSGAKNGIRSGLAIPGDNETSSNLINITQNECHTCSDTAFANFFAYEAKFDQNIIEGNGNCIVGFYGIMEGKTTAKQFDLGTWHLEQTGTAQVAWFKIKQRDQTTKLNIQVVHDATNGILVDIESTNGGGIIFSDLNWFDEAKYFKTKGTTWKFHYCKAIGNSNKNTIWYTGSGYTAPPEGKTTAVGVHSYELVHTW